VVRLVFERVAGPLALSAPLDEVEPAVDPDQNDGARGKEPSGGGGGHKRDSILWNI
jgi:hypothetical protein